MSDFTQIFRDFIKICIKTIKEIHTQTHTYLEPALVYYEKNQTNDYKTYILYHDNIVKYQAELLTLAGSADKYLFDTCLYTYNILFDIEQYFVFYRDLLFDNKLTTKLTGDMSETFMNAVFDSRKLIIAKIDEYIAFVNSLKNWEDLAQYMLSCKVDLKKEKRNKLIIFLIKQNINNLSESERATMFEIISQEKDKLFGIKNEPVQITKSEFAEKNINEIISRFGLFQKTQSIEIVDCMKIIFDNFGIKTEKPAKITIANFTDICEKSKIPIVVIYKSIDNTSIPIEFNLNTILGEMPPAQSGISEKIIEKFSTIYNIEVPINLKNGLYYNKFAGGEFSYVIESLNNIKFRVLQIQIGTTITMQIPAKIIKQLITHVQTRTGAYNNEMEKVIMMNMADDRAEYIVKEYDEDKKSLPNLDFIKNNIIKDLVNIYIEEFNANAPSGEKSAKNQIEKIVSENISKIIYDNIITTVYTESKNFESSITLLLKISAIMEKFRRVFNAQLDKLEMVNIFDMAFKDLRYHMINYVKNLLWATLKEVDGGGLLRNIELSLKEYYAMKNMEEMAYDNYDEFTEITDATE